MKKAEGSRKIQEPILIYFYSILGTECLFYKKYCKSICFCDFIVIDNFAANNFQDFAIIHNFAMIIFMILQSDKSHDGILYSVLCQYV